MAATLIQVESAHRAGAQRWPDLRVPLERFAAHVQRLAIDDARLTDHAADLFLVTAALLGDARAIAHFDREYLAGAAPAVARIDRAQSFVDDVLQQLRMHLLAGEQPRLATYAASGRLLDWVRVAAARTALNAKRAEYRMLPTDDLPLERLLPDSDAELDALRGRYLNQLQGALESCFRQLPPRERNLLRLHFLDGLSLDALATMHGVHRATIARWLVTIRRSLVDGARATLGGEPALTSRSMRSLYRWLAKDVHLSLSRLLAVELERAPSRE